MLAYTVVDPVGLTRIYMRAVDGVESKALPGTEGAAHPFWSPHGESLAFAAGFELKRIDVAGGSVRGLAQTYAPLQGDWNQSDDILLRSGPELVRISAQGGAATTIPNSADLTFPAFLSDGKRFLVRVSKADRGSIQLGALGSTERTLVVDNVLSAPVLALTPRGKTYLLFLRESDLVAQEFDEASGKVLGNPVLLVSSIGRVGVEAVRPTVGVSPGGILAYQNADEATTRRLTWVDRSGLRVHTFSKDVSVEMPSISPDQLSVAGIRRRDIWVTDLIRESSERKTFNENVGSVVWSKDGSRLAFSRLERTIHAIDANGGGQPKPLAETNGAPTSWLGENLLYDSPRPKSGKVYLLNLASDKKPIQVGPPNGYSSHGTFSPDGHYIAFESDRSGRYEVYIQTVPPSSGETRVSINGGGLARWRADGREIFFVTPEGDLMAVDIKLGTPVSVGTPHKLFRIEGVRNGFEVAANGYDVARDGQRFLIVSRVEEVNAPITVVLNWWVELERRVGR